MNLKEACDHLLFSTRITNHEHHVVTVEFVDPLLFLKDRSRILSCILTLKKKQRKEEQRKEEISELDNIPYFYFRNRQTMKTYAGFGISDFVTSAKDVDILSKLQEKCRRLSTEYGCKVNYFASLSFKNSDSYSWGCFPPRLFVLPQVLLICDERTQTQRILFFDQRYHDYKERVLSFNFTYPSLIDIPQKGDFLHNFSIVQDFLLEEGDNNHDRKKVVLALQKHTSSKQLPLDVLQKISSHEKDNFHFLYNIDGRTSFLGCTPEMLCHIQKNLNEHTYTIHSEALAGTVVRGSNKKEDLKLEKKLLHSKKDEEEHQIVIDGIVNVLQKHCSSVRYEQQPSIKKQNFVQHLCTKVTAEYKETSHTASLQDLIFSLHPTPAVCGFPKFESQKVISKIEEFDRGLYAGAIGIISFDEITFCVGIRSALHHRGHYWFWGGAGLVKSSKPEDEFEEMNNKMKTFVQLVVEENKETENKETENPNIITTDRSQIDGSLENLTLKEQDGKINHLTEGVLKAEGKPTKGVKKNNLVQENSLRKKVN